ncbi:hypothetical protein VaNZ11_012273 [Volvox africanus]|uniref:Peptidase S8/S53 domain-containing protein n=1 Tax=Volvox africanus TaxID=51714 RepID=A0ABQ5SF22_9CHLO|nr:hypothetical protein VaNZ11_012273 [Volvox africanus]
MSINILFDEKDSIAPAAAPERNVPGFLEKLRLGWTKWTAKKPVTAVLICITIITCIIIVAVVPSVCIVRGCGARSGDEGVPADGNEGSSLRLLIHFDDLKKTVKSKVPPFLYDYFEELVLSYGVNVVSFKNYSALYKVQQILENQKDVLILLRDRTLYQAPPPDYFLRSSIPQQVANTVLGRRRQAASTTEPGDELSQEQWALDKVAARQAWNTSLGDGVIVAVIDTGCDLEHPDLADNLWVNPREIPGNQVDDDKNGYVDDFMGYDFAGPCPETYGPGCGRRPNATDFTGHGSHCSGIIAAVRNNRVGIAGIAPNVKIMCLKVTPNDRKFYLSNILVAIDYAIKEGAHVISCSFGPEENTHNPQTGAQRDALRNETDLYRLALNKLKDSSMLLVAAAGNEAANLDDIEYYNPCTLIRDFPDNVMCVMATDTQDKRLEVRSATRIEGSNYGPRTVSVAAPGNEILSTVINHTWANSSGSSMATPMVAGVAALVLSILGAKDANFYKGPQAKSILVESAVSIPNLGNRRIDASAAVQTALLRLTNVIRLVPLKDFNADNQWTTMEGFNLTYYYNKTIAPENIMAEDTKPVGSWCIIDGYKSNNSFLVVRANMYLPKSGRYSFQIKTDANFSNLEVYLGQAQLRNLSEVYVIQSTAGWYDFELRYKNPVKPIRILMADPGAAVNLGNATGIFFITSDAEPRNLYYAPDIALSSAWQVLTRRASGPLNASAITTSSLKIDHGFNTSTVIDDLNITSVGTILGSSANAWTSPFVGIAHTRFRPPPETAGALRFQVTCELCALYVNGLRVVDVYDPSLRTPLQPVTQNSNCITLNVRKPYVSTIHDLVLYFALNGTGTTILAVGWLPCTWNIVRQSLKPYIMNNLLWQPSSGVAGYVPGMQCDVWLSRPDINAQSWAPLIKFRLPTVLAHTAQGIRGSLPGAMLMGSDTDVYSVFNASGCSAMETAVGGNCSAAAGFVLAVRCDRGYKDIINKGFMLSDAAPAYMRCWTYVNGGFPNGTVQTLKPTEANIYLGSQRVLASPDTVSIVFPSYAPNATTMNGHYQLLVMEFPGLRLNSLAGLRNGSGKGFFIVDTVNTLLPIPLISTSTAGRHLQRRRLSTADPSFYDDLDLGLDLDLDLNKTNQLDHNLPNSQYDQQIHEGRQAVSTGNHNRDNDVNNLNQRQLDRRRRLQLDLPANSFYDPKVLGASSYTGAVTPSTRGLCGFSFAMTPAFTDQPVIGPTLKIQTVFYNFSLNAGPVLGTPCNNASAGLSDAVCSFGVTPPSSTPPHRMVQFEGFLRVPISRSAGSGTTGTMRPWVLRVTDDAAPLQTTSITVGDVTVRNGVESPNPVRAGETVVWLPGSGNTDLFLPAVVTARIRPAGTQIVFNVTLISPERTAQRVDNNFWYCNNG